MSYPENLILMCRVGSQAYGVATEHSDEDRMGIYVESRQNVMGLHPHDHVVSQGSEKTEDQVLYSVRKWARLACKGNPTVLELLWAPVIDQVGLGQTIREHAELFVSKAAAGAYLGYAKEQRLRLAGLRGQKNINRAELIEQHGYDTKYASQIVRLLHHGLELLETGALSFPLQEEARQHVLRVKRGELSLPLVLAQSAELEDQLLDLRDKSSLPKTADVDKINDLLVRVHEINWYGQ